MSGSSQPKLNVTLRPYQQAAVRAWREGGRRGVVVLPTGAGKTAVGAAAITLTSHRVLVVVPTRELLQQWSTALRRILGVGREQIQIGFPGDESGTQLSLFAWEPPDILISTYTGAARNLEQLHHFSLLIFDEVHHLPAPVYRKIAEVAQTEQRLGLTATPERYDGAEAELLRLVGPTVYRKGVHELAAQYLAPHDIAQVDVDLNPAERLAYDQAWKEYTSYVRRARLRMPGGYQELIKRAGRDGSAKKALDGHRRAREIALSAHAKIQAVKDVVAHHAGEQILVFCQHVDLAERIGSELDCAVATHQTPQAERTRILNRFRDGAISILVATSILDEGVDVPDASVGIIVSGTGQPRQFVQRLGRLIRPGEGKAARLYEIVTRDTLEERAARRRRAGTSAGRQKPLQRSLL